MSDYLLEVDNLKMHFPVRGGILRHRIGTVHAVDGVSLCGQARPDDRGVVGESGCGKTTVGRTILRLYRPTGGRVFFEGRDLAAADRRQLRKLRRDMQIIFQDPFESLNARHMIGDIIREPFEIHNVGTADTREAGGGRASRPGRAVPEGRHPVSPTSSAAASGSGSALHGPLR